LKNRHCTSNPHLGAVFRIGCVIARFQQQSTFPLYIAAVKPLSRICVFLIVAALSPLCAFDGESVTVKSSSVANGIILLEAKMSRKDAEFECFANEKFCTAAKPGEYVMVKADENEGIYNDCTNVVLSRVNSGVKEKVGVYCWLNSGDCYIVTCTPSQVETVPSSVQGEIATEPAGDTGRAQSNATFNISRPTVLAFFAPVRPTESKEDAADSNEALADFQLYGREGRKRLEEAGVDYKEVYASRFRVQLGGATSIVRPAKSVGYYFVAPGKKAHIEYGVLTDTDLLQEVKKYFGDVKK
jgi:hypothetical protein